MTTEKTHTKCPGTGCTDQGCPAHYADSANHITTETAEVVKLVEALEGLLAIVNESDGVSGYYLYGDIAKWSEFEEVEMAKKALATYHQQKTINDLLG